MKLKIERVKQYMIDWEKDIDVKQLLKVICNEFPMVFSEEIVNKYNLNDKVKQI